MATPAQLQAQAAELEIQIALLTRQIESANTPASQQASLIVQRSQLQNDLVIVQQETTALTQQTNPPDPQVPAATENQQVVEAANANNTVNPYAAQADQQNQQVQSLTAEPVTDSGFRPQQSTITGEQVVKDPTNLDPAQDPGVRSPFGGGAFNDAAARNPEAIEQNLQAANEAATKQKAQEQAAIQAQFQTPASGDWRVRLRLAPGATYLYKDKDNKLLAPLYASDGVVFPYMPSISTSYVANYDTTDLVHSNYRGYFYRNSNVNAINITGKFTAQDTFEANYLLAVITFFRSVTKMFYGQDWQRGAPPPLVYLIGLGEYQYNNHPCVVSSFSYNLPADVDYIRTKPNNYNVNLGNRESKPISGPFSQITSIISRLQAAALPRGAQRSQPDQGLVEAQSVVNTVNSTYVPTSLDISIELLPIQTRQQVSQSFSVKDFSNGTLLKKGFW